MKETKENGITLIALIITIIVMLILVGVTVSVALNGGLFTTAKEATKKTQIEADREELLSEVVAAFKTDGKVDFSKLSPSGWTGSNGTYTSPKGNTFTVTKNGEIKRLVLSEKVTVVPYNELTGDIKKAVDDGKIQTVLKETIGGTEKIAVVPTGFEISTVDGENSISGGLVIRDGANEFVWVPVTNAQSYSEDSFGPLTEIDSKSNYVRDSQPELNYYYGTKKDGTPYFDYANDFNYAQDKTNIETNIRTYGGFYVGRYETTIDENETIGSMKNKPILTANKAIAQTNNKATRWWGLYKVQKDMYANNSSVGSLMISSKQWDAIIKVTGDRKAKRPTNTYKTKPDLSGSAYITDPTKYDVAKNIYDLAGNVYEWTLKTSTTYSRVDRGRLLRH